MEKNFTQVYKINSKEFWKNYWFYYKPHTLWGIVVILVIGFSIHSCATRVDPDFSVFYIGQNALMTNETSQATLEKYINDVDGDGKKSALITNLSIGDGKDAQMSQASFTKADLELSVGDPFVFVTDNTLIDRYVQMEGFEDITELTKKLKIPEERLVKNSNTGEIVAVDVTGTKFAGIIGVVAKNKVYTGVKVFPMDKKNNQKYAARHNEVLRMYEFILNDKFE